MIGHYVNNLSPEQEDAALTQPMRPGGLANGCLLAVTGYTLGGDARLLAGWKTADADWFVGYVYDWLCRRFGASRVNAAIRNRILSNRARRILGNALVGSGETPQP